MHDLEPDSAPAPGLEEALNRLERLADAFGARDLATRARDAGEPLERGEIWIVVVGQFKRGKSTLLNALLGQAILPTGIVPVTSVVTQIRWAPEPRVRVESEEGVEEVAVTGLVDFVSEAGNPGNRRGIRRVEVGLPSPLLEGGVVLVDTPGIGSMDTGATERAYAFLPRVDSGILVLSPGSPLSETEGKYLRALLDHTGHLIFVLNKVDLFSEEEWRETVAFLKEGLGRILGLDPDAVEVTAVSAARGLTGQDEGIRDLERRILELAGEKGKTVSRGVALRRFGAVAGELRARLLVEEQAIHLSDSNLSERMAGLEELRGELALRRAEARPLLLDGVRRLVEATTDSLREQAVGAREGVVGAVKDLLGEEPSLGNQALARAVSEETLRGVREVFDRWWTLHGEEVGARLKEAMTRAASGVDATGSTLSRWVEEELGVSLPPPPPPLDLVDSHHFYYDVRGMKSELTFDLLELLLPRRFFRWRIGKKAHRLVAEDLELNVGRIRGDVLYRAQETVRRFFADLEKQALEAEEGVQAALSRALRLRAGAQEEGAAELDRLASGAAELEQLFASQQKAHGDQSGTKV